VSPPAGRADRDVRPYAVGFLRRRGQGRPRLRRFLWASGPRPDPGLFRGQRESIPSATVREGRDSFMPQTFLALVGQTSLSAHKYPPTSSGADTEFSPYTDGYQVDARWTRSARRRSAEPGREHALTNEYVDPGRPGKLGDFSGKGGLVEFSPASVLVLEIDAVIHNRHGLHPQTRQPFPEKSSQLFLQT